MHRPSLPRRFSPLAALLLTLAACAVNPVTGERELSLVSESQEIQMGREADGQIESQLGLVDNPDLQSYVSNLGQELAAVSERPGLPWEFHVVDDPQVNAFALPGGFIYVTRGILGYFETEAELAGVLGHEIGHVTARHSVSQMSRQQLQQIGLGVGMILSEDVREYGGLVSAGLGLLNLSYSRDDESQSDELGARYMTRLGYDPDALQGVFRMLASVSGGGEGRVPEWQLTHPYPENREEHIRQVIANLPAADTASVIARDRYLDHIDGLVWGNDPRHGFFQGPRFVHPEMAFELTFPQGWETVNQTTVVAGVSPEEDAVITLQAAADAGDPEAALRGFLGQEGVQGGSVRTGTLPGVESARAEFSARTENGTLRGEALFLRHDGTSLQLLGYGPQSAWGRRGGTISAALSSFAPVTDPELLGVQPWRLDIVTLGSTTTGRAFAERYTDLVPVEDLLRLNRLEAEERLPAGTRLKGIDGRPLPGTAGR